MAFSLGNLFKGIGKGGDGSFVGIDIGTSSIKLVQLRAAHGVAVLETYGEIALGPYGGQPVGKVVKLDPEKMAQALKDLMKEANVTAREAGISIPFSSSLITVIDLPQVDAESLKRIVPIEARKYIPVPVSEVSLDWFVIPKDEGQQSAFADMAEKKPAAVAHGQEVLLVAIQNVVLQGYQAIMQAVNLAASFYEIEIFSAVRAALGHGLAPVLVVDLGASTTKMYVVERGVVRMTHLLTIGGQQITETLARTMTWEFEKAERVKREKGFIENSAWSTDESARIKEALLSTLSRIFTETNRVLLSYGQRYNKDVSSICFTGGGASLPGLAEVAKTAINAQVSIAEPFSRTEAPAFLASVLGQIGPSFTVPVGLALRKLKRG
ncbi:MAG TPA: type IV pilus assembly protein PilM [Candidatus Paceibacterota bacterium]|nr:type IV pilus assembly protein PilM [Candidatus Paceibacterota bacterium]